MTFAKETKKGIILKVLVKPNSSENRIIEILDDKVVIEVKAPPVKGRANRELIRFLRKKLNTSDIEILKGETSREKILLIKGIALDTLIKQIQ